MQTIHETGTNANVSTYLRNYKNYNEELYAKRRIRRDRLSANTHIKAPMSGYYTMSNTQWLLLDNLI